MRRIAQGREKHSRGYKKASSDAEGSAGAKGLHRVIKEAAPDAEGSAGAGKAFPGENKIIICAASISGEMDIVVKNKFLVAVCG